MDLSASIPTTGVTNPVSGIVSLYGGGNLTVEAGRNVTSGVYYVGNGVGDITARGAIMPDETVAGQPLGTILALGQGTLNVTAGNGLEIESVLNPTVLGQPSTAGPFSYFFTYSPTSSVALTALAGPVTLENNDYTFLNLLGTTSAAAQNETVEQETWYPGRLPSPRSAGISRSRAKWQCTLRPPVTSCSQQLPISISINRKSS